MLDSAGGGGGRADLANKIYVGAAQDGQLALEAAMPVASARPRGVLTFALEQGLTTRGADGRALAADLDADGAITVGEIASWLD